MRWELLVGLRYLRTRRRVAFLSMISLISLLGVMIGVATLDIVLAVMTGLESDLREKILGMNPHVVVMSYGAPLTADPTLVDRVRTVPGVVAADRFVYGQAMLAVGRSASGVVVRGIDPAAAGAVVDVARHLESGSLAGLATPHAVVLPPEEGGGKVELPGILLGAELARTLGVTQGDVVNLISPLAAPGPGGMVPRIKRFAIAGVFNSGMFDYDTSLAYVGLADAQRFFELRDGVSGIEVRVRDIYAARDVARRIEATLGGFPYRARDWMEVNRNLFAALKLEKVVYGIVLCLIVVVAAFNILATLTMVVKEKRRDIAILKSMGAAGSSIARIFIMKGTVIGVTGCRRRQRARPLRVLAPGALPVHRAAEGRLPRHHAARACRSRELPRGRGRVDGHLRPRGADAGPPGREPGSGRGDPV